MTVQARITPGDGDARHGTMNGYHNHKCRCEECRAAWVAYQRGERSRRAQRITPDDPRHGLETFYFNHSCRCPACKEAHRIADLARKARAS